MALTTIDAFLEAWAEQIETMEQNLETLYGAAMNTPVLPSVTTKNGMLEYAAEQTELSAWRFAKLYNYLSTEANTTRIVDVPDTALYYGQIVKIGGNTVAKSGEFLSAEVTSVISKDAAGNTLQTYPIPAEIQALEGYGWSAGSVYNYIDFERKVFVKNVARVDLGVYSWSYIAGANARFNTSAQAYIKPAPNNSTKANILTIPFKTDSYGSVFAHTTDKSISITPGSIISVYDSSYTDATAFKSAMNGVYLYYELSTPIETDISAYITDSDIKVVPGGKLTFDNSNNIDVPSEVKYIS